MEADATKAGHSAWDPRGWSLTKKLAAAVGAVVVIVAVIVGAVLGVRANRYPNYTKLDYSLVDTYSGSDFFNNFYYATSDPSGGFVQYIDRAASEWLNLTYATDTSAVLKVDTTYSGSDEVANGRQSVRITSNNTYADGLFVFDILHTPLRLNWPAHGEIDVMEAVNMGEWGNQATLHTSSGCNMGVKRKETGTALHKTCYWEANDESCCGVRGAKPTYGPEFNAQGGGVYAMELRDAGIRVWNWVRADIPSDITSGSPDPSTWGKAYADFPSTECDIGNHFKNQSIIANIDFCGGWASATKYYTTQSGCPDSCETFVMDNASNFTTAYWEFKSFKVYQANA
ncbi:uncharacterized protein N7477_003230 [Penicillium maclennaniae]|uniref:uncharacterized protein n=1 Tax=Penicillium maclennaniae TaxID=1343394 RepID=UPI00253F92AC|nr:uncharacterized protein N7477_003230 [Penicillium maclennaniae]KAJ5677597.1 hypothetical protein N7477_003230 [Penicillium maclennaniae]